MPRFRKKPIVIEAEQWFPGKIVEGVKETDADCDKNCYCSHPHVHSIHNNFNIISVEPGDWIIKECDGIHYYPCKDYIFKESYEEVA